MRGRGGVAQTGSLMKNRLTPSLTAAAVLMLSLAIFLLCPVGASAAPILTGDSVQATLTSSGTVVTQFTSPAVVGAGIEFTGALRAPGKAPTLYNVVVDIFANGFSIGWTSPTPDAFISGGGILLGLSLSGLNFTPTGTITDVNRTGYSCAPASSVVCGIGPISPGLSFTADSISVAFGTLRAGETYTFDIAVAESTVPPTPVPEPTSLALLGTGFATFIAGRYRRRGKAAIIPSSTVQ